MSCRLPNLHNIQPPGDVKGVVVEWLLAGVCYEGGRLASNCSSSEAGANRINTFSAAVSFGGTTSDVHVAN